MNETTTPSDLDGPWRGEDVLRWGVGTFVGAALSCWAWWQVSSRADWGDQIMPANVAIVGVVITSYAQAAWLLRGWRATAQRRRALVRRMSQRPHRPALSNRGSSLLVHLPDGRLFHLVDCPLAQGRAVVPATVVEHHRSNRRPCGVCQP